MTDGPRDDEPLKDKGRTIVPMSVWIVVGAAIGAAVGSGGGGNGAGLLLGALLGGAVGGGIALILGRRRSD